MGINSTVENPTIPNNSTKGTDILRKMKRDWLNVFVWGEDDSRNSAKLLWEHVKSKKLDRADVWKAGITTIRDLLPSKVQLRIRKESSKNVPLKILEKSGFRVLEYLDKGGANIVYVLNPENGKRYTVGVNKEEFKPGDEKKAVKFANYLQSDYEKVLQLFGKEKLVIPQEQHLVFRDFSGSPRVMFLREYVPDPLKDIFGYDETELRKLIGRNDTFANQLKGFLSVCEKNMDYVLNNQLDILGKNNLCIMGGEGEEQLVLLDPHTRMLGFSNDNSRRDDIQSRIKFLSQTLQAK